MFCFAVANGLCETAINPLIANVYSEKKTHYLNILHAGWPGGLIVGGLLAKLLVGNVRWEIPIALYLLPTLWYGVIVLKEQFPKSDVAKAGISFGQMLKEFASPILICLLLLQVGVGYGHWSSIDPQTGVLKLRTFHNPQRQQRSFNLNVASLTLRVTKSTAEIQKRNFKQPKRRRSAS